MSVNKYKIRVNREDKFLNIPLTLTSSYVGQEDVIENTYVASEMKRAINEVVDYEKIRLSPTQDNTLINRVDYSINLLNNGVFPETTTYGSEGFTNDDIKFRRNNFKKSFLNLSFFDSDVPTNQNYLGNITVYSKLSRYDLTGDRGPYDSTESGWSDNSEGGSTSDSVIKATFDEGASDDGLFLGHNCTNIAFPQRVEYILDGEKWKTKTTTTFGAPIPECSVPQVKEGTTVTGDDVPSGIEVTSFFSQVQKVKDDYTIPGKRGTYTVYTVWETNFFLGNSNLVDVWLVMNTRSTVEVVTSRETTTRTIEDESGNLRTVDGDTKYSYDVVTYEDSTKYTTSSDGTIVRGSGEGRDGGSRDGKSPFTESNITGIPNDVNSIPLRFIVENPITKPRGFSEGYYLYHEKAEVPTSIYMRASFNNAKNGLSTDLMTTKEPQDISEVLNKIHVKYDLKIDGDIYYYEIDTSYSDNISVSGDEMVINLYEIQVL